MLIVRRLNEQIYSQNNVLGLLDACHTLYMYMII